MSFRISGLQLLVVGALLAATASAQELRGNYSGTLGDDPVVACFGGRFGYYYYLKFGRSIPLALDAAQTWVERDGAGKSTGSWTVNAGEGGDLTGTWHAPAGPRSSPLRLTRVGTASDDACGSADYNAPRVAKLERRPAGEVLMGGLSLSRSAALKGNVRLLHAPSADAPLRSALTRLSDDLLAEVLQCGDSFYESALEGEADFEGSVEPVVVTPKWLVVTRSASFFCGGAHPDTSFDALVLDRSSGARVDVAAWLKTDPAPLVRRTLKPSPDCKEAIADAQFVVWPTAKGLSFSPAALPHVVAACGETVTLPWSRLKAYLSPAGQEAARELGAGRARR